MRKRFLFFLSGVLMVFLFTEIRQHHIDNFGCELCADKAGYYMYLPAVFQYGFHSTDFPAHSDFIHGNGFIRDTVSDRMVDKFTSGVAIMQLPFYFLGYITAPHTDPFSKHFLHFMNFGAAFWFMLGILFFRGWMRKHTSIRNADILSFLVLAGTNFLYYVLDESLMSHLYSFVCCSGMLYFGEKISSEKRADNFHLFALFFSLAVLIRPTNFFIALLVIFFIAQADGGLFHWIRKCITWLKLIAGIVIFFIVCAPQFAYWKFTCDKYILWSYKDEGFTNWQHPDILRAMFSTQSGFFTYAPIIIIAVSLALKKSFTGDKLSITSLVAFVFMIYMCASWHNPSFG